MTRDDFWNKVEEAMLSYFTPEGLVELKRALDASPDWAGLSPDLQSWASKALPAFLNLVRQATTPEGNDCRTLPKTAVFKAVAKAVESILPHPEGQEATPFPSFEAAYRLIDVEKIYNVGIVQIPDEEGRMQTIRTQQYDFGSGYIWTAREQANIAMWATSVACLFSGAPPELYQELLYKLLFGVTLFYDARHWLSTTDRVDKKLSQLRDEMTQREAGIGRNVVHHLEVLEEAYDRRGGADPAPYKLGIKCGVLHHVNGMTYRVKSPVKHSLEIWDKRIREEGCRRPDRKELELNLVHVVDKTGERKKIAKATILKYWKAK